MNENLVTLCVSIRNVQGASVSTALDEIRGDLSGLDGVEVSGRTRAPAAEISLGLLTVIVLKDVIPRVLEYFGGIVKCNADQLIEISWKDAPSGREGTLRVPASGLSKSEVTRLVRQIMPPQEKTR